MVKKTNSQTELIKVPVKIAGEVKLFINLLQAGEINAVSDLLQKLESKPVKSASWLAASNLYDLWQKVIKAIEPPTTQAFLKQQCQLLELNNSEAVVGFKSSKLMSFSQDKIPKIEKALTEITGLNLTVVMQLIEDNLKSPINYPNQEQLTKSEKVSHLKYEVSLTSEQKKTLSQLKSFTGSQDKFFRLTGYAGTGKSFLMCRYVKWLLAEKITFVVACPTNKAAKSFKNLADESGLDLEVKTVAQLLGQQPELNEDTGIEEFVCNGQADLSDYNIAIIDEFSMVNRDNFQEIVTAARSSILTKVVFVGDEAQLPPVKEKEPIVATSKVINQSATLIKVVRYDGELACVAEAIRSNPEYSRVIYPLTTTGDRSILCLRQVEWRERALALFKTEEYKLNPDYVRFLAWRNRTVDSLNKFVRSKLWGEDAPPFVPGDRLIAKKPLFRPRPGGKGKNKWRILINNSEEAQVIEPAQLTELIFRKQTYQYWQVRVQPEASKSQTLNILHESCLHSYAEQIKYLASKKQWSYYFDLSRMFDDVAYAYALTIHKAQGSTINYVFLDVRDLRSSSDRQKLLYTALTRTKKQVLIYQ